MGVTMSSIRPPEGSVLRLQCLLWPMSTFKWWTGWRNREHTNTRNWRITKELQNLQGSTSTKETNTLRMFHITGSMRRMRRKQVTRRCPVTWCEYMNWRRRGDCARAHHSEVHSPEQVSNVDEQLYASGQCIIFV